MQLAQLCRLHLSSSSLGALKTAWQKPYETIAKLIIKIIKGELAFMYIARTIFVHIL